MKLFAAALLFPAVLSGRVLEYDEEEVNYAEQIYGYSVKFNGCVSNKEINFEEESGMTSKTWVKYAMCSDCSDETAGGCENGGEYLVPIETYVEAFINHQKETQQYYCQTLEYQYEVDMEAYNYNGGEVPTVEYPSYCDQYEKDENEEEDDMQEQMEKYLEGGCSQLGEDSNGDAYYIGYGCSDKGDSINMAIFTDEECTDASKTNSSMFYTITGTAFPWGDENIVSDYCTSCSEMKQEQQGDNNEEDAEDEDNVAEVCENIYEDAWKCEKDGFNGGDETMCAYIESVSVKMEDGTATSMSSSSGMMTFLTTVFSLTTIGLAGYTWYLKDKVSKATINLGN